MSKVCLLSLVLVSISQTSCVKFFGSKGLASKSSSTTQTCDYDVIVSGAGPAGVSFLLELLSIDKKAKALLLEKREEYMRKQVVYVRSDMSDMLEENTGVNMQNLTLKAKPHQGVVPVFRPQKMPDPLLIPRSKMLTLDLEKYLMGSLEELQKLFAWNLDVSKPNFIKPAASKSLVHDGNCSSVDLDKPILGQNRATAKYIVVAEGGRSQTLEDIGYPSEAFSPEKSERVTYYWDDSPPQSAPKFKGTIDSFFLSHGNKAYGFLSLPKNVSRDKIEKYIRLKFLTQVGTNVRFPDQIGFGKSATGADVGTFTVELMHRMKVPAELLGKVFAVGDSLSSVDPWTGSGVNKAIFEGVTAARLIANLLQEPQKSAALLQEYTAVSNLNIEESLNESLDFLRPTFAAQQNDDPDAF